MPLSAPHPTVRHALTVQERSVVLRSLVQSAKKDVDEYPCFVAQRELVAG